MMKDIVKYKLSLVRESDCNYLIDSQVSHPMDVNKILGALGLRDEAEEVFVLLAFDVKMKLIGAFEVSRGSLSSALVHPREVLKRAMLVNASKIIVAHNHPSGDPTPSKEDEALTKRLKDACEIMEIKLLDHVVVGETYYSFKENYLI